MLLGGGAIVVVVAVVVAIVLLSGRNSGSAGTPAGGSLAGPTGQALSAVVGQVTSVPAATLDQVGAGQVSSPPKQISGTQLTSGGKPEVLYIGAEYCPYCAAERWAMIVALNRFGAFSGLATIRSAARNGAGDAEPYPLTPTWTFAHSSYTSDYLVFTPVEEFTNTPDPATGGYTALMALTPAQQDIVNNYDAAYDDAIPFISYGNRYLSVGASYDPGVLSGLTWAQIAADLHTPASPVARAVLGTANYMTAAICGLTTDHPASACTPVVKALQARILGTGQDLTFRLTRGFSQAGGGHNTADSLYDWRMGKASRTKQAPDRRSRIAAQRQAERRAARLKRIYLAGGSVVVVVIVVVALVLVNLNKSSGTAATPSNGPTGAALTALLKEVSGVPTSVTDKVGGGTVPADLLISAPTSSDIQAAATNLGSYFATVDGSPLMENGKPEVLFIGAEYCPFCGAQRWAMYNALSRFGTFTGVKTTHSSVTDSYANTRTLTFYGSKYTSSYIAFTPVETTTNERIGNSSNTNVAYQTLQTPTSAQSALWEADDSDGSIPYINMGGKFVQEGNLSPLNPSLLAGLTWQQIAADMNNPNSAVGKAEIANANYMTAAICKLTGNKPASACTPTIQKLADTLPTS
jgi:thiol-disulfide isomerase/thioredoxin